MISMKWIYNCIAYMYPAISLTKHLVDAVFMDLYDECFSSTKKGIKLEQ